MLLNLWFHHTNVPLKGALYAPRKVINRKKENDEALLLAGVI